jgi:pimeloyl-ACP methyl ester carboxylesterase
MPNKFLLLSAVLLSVVVAGCAKTSDEEDGGIASTKTQPLASLFEPVPVTPGGTAVVPFPNNGLFAGTTDATLNIPNTAGVPFVTAANLTDGFSTTASIFTDLLGFADFATASAPASAPGLIIVPANGPTAGQPLVAGVDYTLQTSPALDATGRTIDSQRTRILIEPLKPLRPSTTYIVAITKNLKDAFGKPAQASEEFVLVRRGTPVQDQDEPILDLLTDAQEATLEGLRSQLIRPTVLGFLALYNGNPTYDPDLTEDDLVLVWPFTTQSIALTLERLDASAAAQTILVANTTVSTGDLGLGLADTADIYAGFVNVPYYLANTGGGATPTAPLATFWSNDGTLNSVNPPALGGAVPCSALAPSTSTTICYPDPAQASVETIPVLVTAPNGNSGQTKPAAGWPVAIFLHGITRNRTDMLALAPTLAAAGFVVVAIDHPLHGLTDTASPFYRNQLFFSTPAAGLMTGERTFDLDLADNTPDPDPCAATNAQPDGVIDSSGSYFINLSSLITSRDNLRQSVADVIHLTKSMVNLDLDNNPGGLTATDIDETRIYFVGQSLGAIVGTTALGVNTDILAASLHVPGGGVAKLLDASKALGPRIGAGLGCSGVVEGTDTYETFLRFAQHLTDPGDPINFAVAANANHAIHMVEVIGDLVVPNAAPQALVATATQDRTLIAGFLSGTEPLYTVMGLDVVGPITPPGDAAVGGADTVVRFAAGTAEHGTLLTPDSSAVAGPDTTLFPATCEMQRQTATFLATNGAVIQIGGTCP